MAIFFRCPCGQDLRADEERAGRRTECPACGELVPVPTLAEANQDLGIASLPPLELPGRPKTRPAAGAECPALPGSDPPRKRVPSPDLDDEESSIYPLVTEPPEASTPEWYQAERNEVRRLFAQARRDLSDQRQQSAGWSREKHWFECLLYPLRAWPVLLILSVCWATLIAVLRNLLPVDDGGMLLAALPVLVILWLVLPLVLLSYTCNFYRRVLASGTEGEAGRVCWPGTDPLEILRTGAACVVSFLAGPVVPLVVAFFFWLHSGDLELVDRLILLELGLIAAGYWTLALFAVEENDRLRAANPLAVARLAGALSREGWVTVGLIAFGVVLHFLVSLSSVEALHRSPGGWVALVWWGFWGMAWIVFLLRWFGLARFRVKGMGKVKGEKGRGDPLTLRRHSQGIDQETKARF